MRDGLMNKERLGPRDIKFNTYTVTPRFFEVPIPTWHPESCLETPDDGTNWSADRVLTGEAMCEKRGIRITASV